jgi:hypothetical protein
MKNMKNIILLIVAIVFTIQCSAQTKVVNITDRDGTRNLETYYKDVDNNLDPFVGTWVHTDGNTSLKIVFKKELKYYYRKHHEDILIGDYQYIENGVEKINTFSRLDSISPDVLDHSISGNTICENNYYPKCDDCLPNEKRVKLFLFDPIQKVSGHLLLRKITVDDKPALKIFKTTTGTPYLVGTTPKDMIVPDGYYTLIKQ